MPSLHKAVWKRDAEGVERLLRERVDVNAVNKNGKTALHLAVGMCRKNKRIVELLLADDSVEVDAVSDDDQTALIIAVEKRRADFVDMLLAAGANANFETESWKTPMSVALEKQGPLHVVQLLLAAGANVNPYNVWYANKYCNEAITACLIS